jgi:hypothetical protein
VIESNRNPWNVRPPDNAPEWDGQIGVDAAGHAIFSHEKFSARAAIKVLQAKQKNGKLSIMAMIDSYAPASDGNDPGEYAKWLGKELGVDPKAEQHLFMSNGEPTDRLFLRRLLDMMLSYERGWAGAGIHLYREDIK